MNKKQFLLSALALITPSLLAQDLVVRNASRKWDGAFDQLIAGESVRRVAADGALTTATPSTLNEVIVNVSSNAEAVADYVKAQGYEAEVITDQCLTASIPAKFVPVLAQRSGVVYVSQSRQCHPLLDSARELTNVDAIHKGTGLDTPFDGTGVVVGIIDQGFQYNHSAFRGHASYYTGVRFSDNLPASGDTYSTSAHGHATHVANIAAGQKVTGDDMVKNLYGVAYAADLLLCSSTFQESTVLSQTKAIKKYAEGKGMPWVVNMSFGGHVGPHDGSTAIEHNMAALTGEGGILVAAAGNEGEDKIHAKASFDEDDQVKSVCVIPDDNKNPQKYVGLDMWSTLDEGSKGLTFQPLIRCNSRDYVPTSSQLRQAFQITDEVNALNNKQHYYLNGSISTLATLLGVPTTSTYYFIVKVTGNTGNGYHAWIVSNSSYPAIFGGRLASYSVHNVQPPTQDYLVGDFPASMEKAVTVAAYVNRQNFRSLGGANYQVGYGTKGRMAAFSSPGPSANPNLYKPNVAAPGAGIYSAFNRFDTNVSVSTADVVARVKNSGDGQYDYYGMMSGTSQATPMTTGIIALWLQANPKLTPEQVQQIIRETSVRDTYTGSADENGWSKEAGYGKIDAYAGLKRALELANKEGVGEVLNSEAPVSLQKNADQWKVLFNSDETYADIQVVTMGGQVVASRHLEAPRRGEESVITLSSLTPGVYLFHVSTTASKLTRKLVVK